MTHFSLSKDGELAVTVTRSCVGIWEIRTGRLLSKLADSPLGAVVTHAEISPNSRYIISSETGKLLIWNRVTEQVLFRDDQPGIQQITLLENGEKFLTVSCPNINQVLASNSDESQLKATAIVRHIPSKFELFLNSFETMVDLLQVVRSSSASTTQSELLLAPHSAALSSPLTNNASS